MRQVSFFAVLSLIAVLLAPQAAFARSDWERSPWYAGIEFVHTTTELNSTTEDFFDDNYPGGGAYLGYRFHRLFAFEIGGFMTSTQEQRFGAVNSDMSLYGGYGSLVFIAPVADSLNLLADAGFSVYQQDVTSNLPSLQSHMDGLEDGFRGGLGFELMMTDEVGFRAMAHYLTTTSDGLDYLLQYNAGINFHF